jgi:F0F1-type ATP synthase membrane subunit c/vacuolar-type H+-ATPase subunit K
VGKYFYFSFVTYCLLSCRLFAFSTISTFQNVIVFIIVGFGNYISCIVDKLYIVASFTVYMRNSSEEAKLRLFFLTYDVQLLLNDASFYIGIYVVLILIVGQSIFAVSL